MNQGNNENALMQLNYVPVGRKRATTVIPPPPPLRLKAVEEAFGLGEWYEVKH